MVTNRSIQNGFQATMAGVYLSPSVPVLYPVMALLCQAVLPVGALASHPNAHPLTRADKAGACLTKYSFYFLAFAKRSSTPSLSPFFTRGPTTRSPSGTTSLPHSPTTSLPHSPTTSLPHSPTAPTTHQ